MKFKSMGAPVGRHTLELQGPPIAAKRWPLLLEQLLREAYGNFQHLARLLQISG